MHVRMVILDLQMAFSLLLILALLATVFAQSSLDIGQNSPNCTEDFLSAVTQDNGAVGISVFYNDDAYVASSGNHLQLSLQGKELSSECGNNFIRCKDPLTLTTPLNKTSVQHRVFFPLADGLQIVEHIQTGLHVEFGEKVLLETQTLPTACSPVKAFDVSNDYFLICVNSQEHYIAMHRIFVNKTRLKDSQISAYPLTELQVSENEDMQTLSNFVFFTEGSPVQMILFAIGNCMYAFDIVSYTVENEYGSIGDNCTHVKYLEYIGNYRFLAYCKFTNVYYSAKYEDWEEQWFNDHDGIPYTCPNGTIHLSVFVRSTYIKYSINSLVGNINLLGEGFHSGICLAGADRTTLFAYTDLKTGVFIVNMTSFEVSQVLTTSCETSGCLSIDLMNDRYLVIREANKQQLRILDALNDLAAVITVDHYFPVLFSHLNGTNELSTCGRTIAFDRTSNTGAIVGYVFGAVAFIVLVAVIMITVIAGLLCRPKPLAYPTQVEDDGQPTDVEKVLVTKRHTEYQPNTSHPADDVSQHNVTSHRDVTSNCDVTPTPSELTRPQQPVDGAIPVEERGVTSPRLHVGNSDSPPSGITSCSEHPFGAAMEEHIQMQNLATIRPTNSDGASNIGTVEFLGMNEPLQNGSILNDMPKLALQPDNDREKGDNPLESSHSSTSVDDDEAPLLSD